jgi:hypothetical protein
MKWEYCTLEWLWNSSQIKINFPSGREKLSQGSYHEIVNTLNELGAEGWEAVNCVSGGNWLYWTLKRGF